LGNPGKGGWAAIIFDSSNNKTFASGSEKITTNNRMELLAPINALKKIKKKSTIIIYTDSKYVINGINNWIKKWKINKWRTSNKKDVKNKDLWVLLDNQMNFHKITWEWVKGHSGNVYNEEADKLARDEAEKL